MTSSESYHLRPAPVLGYTTRRHLLLDLDNTSLSKVIKLAKMIMSDWEKVGDCLICRSSHKEYDVSLNYYGDNTPFIKRKSDNYHLIYDNSIGYNLCVKICEVLARLGVLERDYVKIRRFRGDMTLRASPAVLMAGTKPAPKPLFIIFNGLTSREDGYINRYLIFLGVCHRLFGFESDSEINPDYTRYSSDARGQENPVDVLVNRDTE